MSTTPMNYIRAYTPSDARRVVDVFSSGLVPLKDFFAFEDEVFFALKHCTDCYAAEQAPCGVCREGMQIMNRAEDKLVYTVMTSLEYIEATHSIARYRAKQEQQEQQKRKREQCR